MKKILIIWGGWQGHQPEKLAKDFRDILVDHNYQVDLRSDIGVLINEDLKAYDVIVPIWSCGISSHIYIEPLLEAVRSGVGFVTWHGGINWFDQGDYYDLIGAYYLRDTPVESYRVFIEDVDHTLVHGVEDFDIESEVYYLLVNPLNQVLAKTQVKGKDMPLIWTKTYGCGRVFYSSLAHDPDQVLRESHLKLLLNAIEWAGC